MCRCRSIIVILVIPYAVEMLSIKRTSKQQNTYKRKLTEDKSGPDKQEINTFKKSYAERERERERQRERERGVCT